MDVFVYSLEGKIVAEFKDIHANESIDLGYLNKGMYFVEIKTGKEILTKKIVLN